MITIDELPDYETAVNDFRRFLKSEGHPDEIVWVFRDDTWFQRIDERIIRLPDSSENEALSEKVYLEGKAKGLASITAIATYRGKVVATVWFPKYAEEEVQGWDRGLKLSIRIPLPEATAYNAFIWSLVRLLPSYRRAFQKLSNALLTIFGHAGGGARLGAVFDGGPFGSRTADQGISFPLLSM